MSTLERRFPRASLFLSTDTSFSDCCSDFITAAHVQADAVVKFGPSCTFPGSEGLPLYVVPWGPRASCPLQEASDTLPKGQIIVVSDFLPTPEDGGFEVRTWQSLDASRPGADVQVISYHQESWVGDLLCLLMPQNRIYQISEGSSPTELSCIRAKSRR